MASRGRERVAPPPVGDEWDLRFAKNDVKAGWEQLCRMAPENTRRAYDEIRSNPCPAKQTSRQFRLRGNMKSFELKGENFPLWQYEVTGAARIHYCVMEHKKTILFIYAGTAHPKSTE